jgi:hypothetical protein
MLQRSPSIGDIYLLKTINPPFNREAGHDSSFDDPALFIFRAAKSQGVKLSSLSAPDAQQSMGVKQTNSPNQTNMMNNAKSLRFMQSKSMTDNNGRNTPITIQGERKIILQLLDEVTFFIAVIFVDAADGAVNVAAIPAQFEKGKYAAGHVVIMVKKFRSPPNKSTV